ncbi:hypothetical protein [uncultured Methanomethylovorans sp.]|uniref:hypothetical protein n=1 Tax=uncultured Methanomethylovorans sp. TaxID=183759 RepID=UPI003748BA1A
MASLVVGLHDAAAPLSVSVFPEVPVEGKPVLVTFNLNNPSLHSNSVDYELYANGKRVMEGTTELSSLSSEKYQYTYVNPLKMGEQITFAVKSTMDGKSHDESVSLPAYPPQVWSSFVSFASFSTSVMSYMTTMTYYDQVFENGATLNVSVIFSIVLIGLLIYLELTEPSLTEKSFKFIGDLRIRFSRLSTVLFVIFIGMVFTQVALIIGKVG